MHWFFYIWPLILSFLPWCSQRRFHIGPTVDPGVFVLTHVGSCRSGRGYCVLGFNCAVDKDFLTDDLGGNCDGLKTAFNPEASFVCCRENPANYIVKPETTTTTTTTAEPRTTIFTELETETEVFTEIVTKVEEVTEINAYTVIVPEDNEAENELENETLRPGIVIDDPSLMDSLMDDNFIADEEIVKKPSVNKENINVISGNGVKVNCYAAILLGIKCEMSVKNDDEKNELEKMVRKSSPAIENDSADAWLEIKTTKIDFKPEKDDHLSIKSTMKPISSTTTATTFRIPLEEEFSPFGDININGGYHVIEEPIYPLNDNVTEEAITEVDGEDVTEVTEEATKKINEEAIIEVNEEAIKKVNEEVITERNEGATTKVTNKITEQVTGEGITEVNNEAIEQVTNEAYEQVTDEAIEQATNEAIEQVTDEAIEQATNEEITVVTEEEIKGVTNGAIKGVTEEEIKGVTNGAIKGVTEEVTEKAMEDSTDVPIENEATETIMDKFNKAENKEEMSQCGYLGGKGIFDAFGRAGLGILPDLVASWVTGHSSQKEASEFIGGGTVTSTVIYCWMIAIVRKKETLDEKPAHDQLICTGTLVHTDLVLISASCTIEYVFLKSDNCIC